MSAGQYSTPYTHKVRTLAAADTFGERAEVHTAQAGRLWGTSVENLGSQTEEEFRSDVQRLRGTIRLRNYPSVNPRDQLIDPDATTWTVENCYAGDNETICEVTA